MITLFIADGDHRFIKSVQNCITNLPWIELIGIADNGNIALEQILRLRPDVVLMDAILTGMDGLTLLRNLTELPAPPMTAFISRFYSDVCLEAARRFGACLALGKPVSPDNLCTMLFNAFGIYQNMRLNRSFVSAPQAPLEEIRKLLNLLALSPSHDGTNYLIDAMLLLWNDATLLTRVTKGLYPKVAARSSSTPQRVERSMRAAIVSAFQRGDMRNRFDRCPTNSEFLRYLLNEAQKA